MTATLIRETLANEFSIKVEAVQSVLEMIDAGLSSTFIGRFRRDRTDTLSESQIRRLQQRRLELEELDRRRGTILRTLEREEGMTDKTLDPIRRCMDRFELEDLFVPHRRPEPEVQLALDRGLGALADVLVKAIPVSERKAAAGKEGAQAEGEEAKQEEASAEASSESAPAEAPSAEESAAPQEEAAPAEAAAEQEAPAAPEAPAAEVPTAEAPVEAPAPEAEAPLPEESAPDAEAGAAAEASSEEAVSVEATQPAAMETRTTETPSGPVIELTSIGGRPARIHITPELIEACQPFVQPDRGVHTEAEALAGAVRILSDRLARNAHLRGLVRRMLRKRGVLKTRQLVEGKKLGRHKPLLKIKQPLPQVQGHRLIAIRQAQKERAVATVIELDLDLALPKVRNILGRHTQPAFDELLGEVARHALEFRILPMVEADVRLELKERGDQEALRFLSQHLRQVLLTPVFGPHAAAAIDVNAKGDWTLAVIEGDGSVVRCDKIEVGEKDDAALGAELAAFLGLDSGVRAIALGHGKGPRAIIEKLRSSLQAGGLDQGVAIVNESGLSSYANSELARQELGDQTVPQRMAVSLARRLQDPMAEILKVDPRHLGLGSEQGLVSKANAKRMFEETIESCVAHVGCHLNEAPLSVLRNIPGLDLEAAQKLIEQRPFQSREQLRTDAVLTEAQWTSSIAFLRMPESSDPLDRTALHPEQYDLVKRLLESAGGSVEDNLGRPGVTKGLRRASFEVDEYTWRDLMRELSQPGRDPRFRLHRPELMAVDTDPVRLTKDRVVEGFVTNVASFGAFVYVGLGQDAMIHISEMASRYVRDARELLSIGQTVRARISEEGGQRLALSLKNVPAPERAPRRGRGGGGGRGRGGRGRGGRDREEEGNPNLRARRDGMGGARRSGGTRRGGGGRGGRGRDGGRRGNDEERLGREERVALERANAQANKDTSFSPFAQFFKTREDEGGES